MAQENGDEDDDPEAGVTSSDPQPSAFSSGKDAAAVHTTTNSTTTQPVDADPYHYDFYESSPLPHFIISHSVPPPPCRHRKVGRLYVLLPTKRRPMCCVVGPCYPMIFVTCSLITLPSAGVLGAFGRRSLPAIIVGCVLTGCVLCFYFFTACRDPGVVPRRQHPVTEGELYDDRGKTFRPRNAVFDYETGVVVESVDHFCPWVGTLVAKNNLRAFRLFTSTLCLLILYSVGLGMWCILTGNL